MAPTVIGAITAYNEAHNIKGAYEALCSLGVQGIHILDGPWQYSGYTAPKSTDGMDKVIAELGSIPVKIMGTMETKKIYTGPRVVFDQENVVYRNEPDKRNRQLELIRKHWPGAYYALVLDADERVRFPNGLDSLDVGQALEGANNLVGMVKAFASGGTVGLYTPRLIPLLAGMHYHTERRLTLHGHDCEVISDYNEAVQHTDLMQTFEFSAFFIVNHWPDAAKSHDGRQRLAGKAQYVRYADDPEQANARCRFNVEATAL